MKFVFLVIILASAALAQSPVTVSLSTPAPPAATVSAVVAGNPGNAQYNYYVITNYPSGSVVSNAALVQFAPVTLTVTNYIQVGWNSLPGVTNYDVVRLTAPATFSGSCTLCKVASGLAANSVQDTGSALTSYTSPSPSATANGQIYINTRDYPSPQIRQNLNGVDSTLGGNSILTGLTATAPITVSGGQTPNISATYQGNGNKVQASTGATTTNDCVKFDANGNTVDTGFPCGSGGLLPAGSAGCVQLSNVTTFQCDPAFSDVSGVFTIGDSGSTSIVAQTATATLDMDSIAESSGQTILTDTNIQIGTSAYGNTQTINLLTLIGTMQIDNTSGLMVLTDTYTQLYGDDWIFLSTGIGGSIDMDNSTPGTLALGDTITTINGGFASVVVSGNGINFLGDTGNINLDELTDGTLTLADTFVQLVTTVGTFQNDNTGWNLGADTGVIDLDYSADGTLTLQDTTIQLVTGGKTCTIDPTTALWACT